MFRVAIRQATERGTAADPETIQHPPTADVRDARAERALEPAGTPRAMPDSDSADPAAVPRRVTRAHILWMGTGLLVAIILVAVLGLPAVRSRDAGGVASTTRMEAQCGRAL